MFEIGDLVGITTPNDTSIGIVLQPAGNWAVKVCWFNVFGKATMLNSVFALRKLKNHA